jgi:hypothetical protein
VIWDSALSVVGLTCAFESASRIARKAHRRLRSSVRFSGGFQADPTNPGIHIGLVRVSL